MDVKYQKRLHKLHSDLPFLSERMEVNTCKKLVCNLFNKKKHVTHINTLKQALIHGLKFKKIHRIIEFNQKEWLKQYIDMSIYYIGIYLCITEFRCVLFIRNTWKHLFCIFSGNCLKSSHNFISTGSSTIEDHSNTAYLL